MRGLIIIGALVCGLVFLPNSVFSLDVQQSDIFLCPMTNPDFFSGFACGDGDETDPHDWSIGTTVPYDPAITDDMVFSTKEAGSWYERMRITKDGNVGIGIPIPGSRLHVVSDISGLAVYGEHSTTGNSGSIGGRDAGVAGGAEWGDGVSGFSRNYAGVFGKSLNGVGVRGRNNDSNNYGSLGSLNFGVYGLSYSGHAGYFDGDVKINGELSVKAVGNEWPIWAESDNGHGVFVHSKTDNISYQAVHAWNENRIAVLAHSGTVMFTPDQEAAVYARNDLVNGTGVYGYGKEYDFYAGGPGVNYGYPSSIRWKKNIEEITNALDKILSIRGVYFDWDKEHGAHHDMGFVAEEVGKHIPEIVSYEDDGVYTTGMDYGAITPVLVQAIKEQQAQINELKAEIAQLKKGELGHYGELPSVPLSLKDS